MSDNGFGLPNTYKDAVDAVEAFEKVDAEFKEYREWFLGGGHLAEVLKPGSKNGAKEAIEAHRITLEKLDELRGARASAIEKAKDTCRTAVDAMRPAKQRGWDGKPTVFKHGKFLCTSFTKRGLDPDELMDAMSRRGPSDMDALLKATAFDAKTSEEYRIVKPTVEIDYQATIKWLVEHGMKEVVEAAYAESEQSPRASFSSAGQPEPWSDAA